MISAALLTLALAGCAAFVGKQPPSRDIGAPPAYLAPVTLADPQAKQSPVVIAAERGAALERANAIIACADAEWRTTRVTLLADERPVDAREAGACPELDAVKARAVEPKVKKRKRLFRRGAST